MIAFAPQFDPSRDHADLSANGFGIIGDSQDKRFTYVRPMGDPNEGEPDYIIEIDWHAAGWYASLVPPPRFVKESRYA